MSISKMHEIIRSLGSGNYGRGAGPQEILDAERKMGVVFPRSYKDFLSAFGWARVSFDMLYGLGADVPAPYDLVKNVFCERCDAHPHIPHHLVPIMNDGAGNHYCLDISRFHDAECPVVFWDHEHDDGPNQSPEEVSPSFDGWLTDLIVNASSPNQD